MDHASLSDDEIYQSPKRKSKNKRQVNKKNTHDSSDEDPFIIEPFVTRNEKFLSPKPVNKKMASSFRSPHKKDIQIDGSYSILMIFSYNLIELKSVALGLGERIARLAEVALTIQQQKNNETINESVQVSKPEEIKPEPPTIVKVENPIIQVERTATQVEIPVQTIPPPVKILVSEGTETDDLNNNQEEVSQKPKQVVAIAPTLPVRNIKKIPEKPIPIVKVTKNLGFKKIFAAILIQKVWRGYHARLQYNILREVAIIILLTIIIAYIML